MKNNIGHASLLLAVRAITQTMSFIIARSQYVLPHLVRREHKSCDWYYANFFSIMRIHLSHEFTNYEICGILKLKFNVFFTRLDDAAIYVWSGDDEVHDLMSDRTKGKEGAYARHHFSFLNLNLFRRGKYGFLVTSEQNKFDLWQS